MPRQKRRLSKNGCYHAIVRGNDKMDIFLDDTDKSTLLRILNRAKEKFECSVLAYCFMDNHIHLVLMETNTSTGENNISTIMKFLGVTYVRYFNEKYQRVGTLFQERFKSEPIESDRHLLAVVRYVLLNPCKAGLAESPVDYKWSSSRDYMCGTYGITDTGMVLGILDKNSSVARQELNRLMDNDVIIESTSLTTIPKEAKKQKALLLWDELQQEKLSINEKIKKLYDDVPISIRTLATITGIGRARLARIIKEETNRGLFKNN